MSEGSDESLNTPALPDAAPDRADILQITRDIVVAYLSHNTLDAEAVPEFLEQVHATVCKMSQSSQLNAREKLVPAVPIEESVTEETIYCLEDGLPFKSLKRHIRVKYGLTPETYREKWGLPADYPMVAPNYARERSALAKPSGLGRKTQNAY